MDDERKFDPKKFRDELHDQIHSDIHARIHREIHNRIKTDLRRDLSLGLFWGAILVIVGLTLLLDHMGMLSAWQVFRFWPVVLIVFGGTLLLRGRGSAAGIILVIAGAVLQAHELGYVHVTFGDFWALGLIAAGILIMWHTLSGNRVWRGMVEGDSASTLNELAVFGGFDRPITAKDFRGGKVMAVFGGGKIDLRRADIEGDEAVLDASAVFGGYEIRVPETWNVSVRGLAVAGAYVNSTQSAPGTDPGAPKKTLFIKGMVVFGGVELKN